MGQSQRTEFGDAAWYRDGRGFFRRARSKTRAKNSFAFILDRMLQLRDRTIAHCLIQTNDHQQTTQKITMNRNDLNEAFCLDESSATLDTSVLKTPSAAPSPVSSSLAMNESAFSDEHRQDYSANEAEEESIALARQLMAEEAMASYQSSFQLLQQHATQFSPEDYQALQAAMMEDDDQLAQLNDQVDEDEGDGSAYETLLDLSERIGDVKAERWSWRAPHEIAKLPSFVFSRETTISAVTTRDDSECKCLVCQCEYENGEQLCRLPCQHTFHEDCVKPWLMKKDVCPYCRQCIVKE